MSDSVMKDSVVEEFVSLTNCSKKLAKKYLSQNQWYLNYALNEYYDKELGTFTEIEPPPQYPIELEDLFNTYSSPSKQAIEAEGLMQLISDLGYQLEDLVTLCLTDLMKCQTLTIPIEKEQFMSTWYENGCSQMEHMKLVMSDLDADLHRDIEYFTKIYRYSFKLIVDVDDKMISIPTAIQYWKLFFDPQYPTNIEPDYLQGWFSFLADQNKEAINQDSWQMTLEFFKKYSSLDQLTKTYSPTDPWPYIIDEFYEYITEKATA